MARGPMAVAIDNDRVLILDNENERVVAVAADGLDTVADGVHRTSEDMAVDANGALALYSPLHSSVQLRGKAGQAAGSVEVPRTLRTTARLELGPSRQVELYSALQERLVLGSPAAPKSLATVLHSRREGAYVVDDHVSVVARAGAGQASFDIIATGSERSRVVESIEVPGAATAAQIFGGAGRVVCARVEDLDTSLSEVDVSRRAVCFDLRSRKWVVDEPLPDPGIYLPRRELAMTANERSVTVAHLHAGQSAAQIAVCEVSR